MNDDFQNIYVVIPAKDEDNYIEELIIQIKELGFANIVVVNDQSADRTKEFAERNDDVVVLDHVINLGAGASTQTGIAYAVSKDADIILTIDADLQHNPQDLTRLVGHMKKQSADLVIGSRFISRNDIPKSRVFYNKVANLVSFLLTGSMLTDSQSGLKAISKDLSNELNLTYDGFEFCMEIIKQAKSSNFKISEIPVDVRYTEATTKKGQNLWSGFNMIARLFSPFN